MADRTDDWWRQNRHLLSYGMILGMGGELTVEEQTELDEWYRKAQQREKEIFK